MLRVCNQHGYFRGEVCTRCSNKGKFLMNTNELDITSRLLARLLRHNPPKYKLRVDKQGYVNLHKLIYTIRRIRPQFYWLRPHHIRAVVETDPKGRYQLVENKIRATYGHTFDIPELNLPTDNIPAKLYYPTTEAEVELLLETGLKPTDRKKVHLSKTPETAEEAGKHRCESPLILEVDTKRMLESGFVIYRAGTTVFTTAEVPPEFISIYSKSK